MARASFRTPTVELREVKLRGIGLEGGALDLVLNVYNPNEYRLDATKLTYTLLAETTFVASGEINKRVTLNGRNHNDISLPLTFTMKELLGAAEVIVRKGSVNYTVKGEVTVDTPFGSATRPYQGKATLDNGTLIRP
jgi:LEA14-like dessication related protein